MLVVHLDLYKTVTIYCVYLYQNMILTVSQASKNMTVPGIFSAVSKVGPRHEDFTVSIIY